MTIIIFDTNAWLDLYMVHPLALKEIILKFKKKKNSFWIPEQVYWEFCNHSNFKRESALNAIKNVSSNTREKTTQAKNQIRNELMQLKNNVILTDENIINVIEGKFDEIRKLLEIELNTLNRDYQKGMGIITEEKDVIYKLINEIYQINPPYILTEVQRIKLYEEGELRIKYNIPPGLTDIDKDGANGNVIYRRRYGDFLIWKDVLRKVEELVRTAKEKDIISVIFVENEKKGDWWVSRGKPTISPILKEEFESIANGKAKIEMMNFTDFLTKHSNLFGIENTTVKALVEKNKYKENVISEINNKSKEILERVLVEHFAPVERYEKLFTTKSYLGGVFKTVKDFSINIKEFENIQLDENERGLYLSSKIDFEYLGKLTEQIDSDYNETEIVKDTHNIVVIAEISIDYSLGYDSNHYDVGKVYVQGFQKVKQRNSKLLRNKVFERDRYTCQICGKSIDQGVELRIEHIIPYSAGGTDDFDNLITVCNQHNSRFIN